MPVEFVIFGLLLLGIALFHHHTFDVALVGTVILISYKIIWTQEVVTDHLAHEARLLINLLGLLLGFPLLSKQFEESQVPIWLPGRLPRDWTGGMCLLAIVGVISMFLDNIAGAIIGGLIARRMYNNKVCLSFIIALVGASNAGGAGSVIGDTTTTMMWIAGIPPYAFLKAFLGASIAILFSGIIASRAQHAYQPLVRPVREEIQVDAVRLIIVAILVLGTIWANIAFDFPAVGLWAGIVIGTFIRPMAWSELQLALKGSLFLILLVVSASFMPVDSLPTPTWQSALGLGVVSAVFDNIPLTALAIFQGGYDWGILAYTVGYGGSLLWFGSSAGVAITTMFPQAKNSMQWIRHGWHVLVIMLVVAGWHP
jgi:Na+/H+ antiporter NhaD/arsenite permease-like protein